jgi:hypothetical protein
VFGSCSDFRKYVRISESRQPPYRAA